MSSNGAGRASVPGVGCRVSVLAAEVGAAAVLFMSQRARTFDYATTTLFFSKRVKTPFTFVVELAVLADESQSEVERRIGAL